MTLQPRFPRLDSRSKADRLLLPLVIAAALGCASSDARADEPAPDASAMAPTTNTPPLEREPPPAALPVASARPAALPAPPRVVEMDDRPAIGSLSADGIDAYLRGMDERRRVLEQQLKDATTDEERATLRSRIHTLKAFRNQERARLTKRDGDLIGAGAAFTGIGGAALLTSAVLGVLYAFSGFSLFESHPPNESLKTASFVALGTGVGCSAIGVPMLVVGMQRVPKQAGDAFAEPPQPVGLGTGASLSWRF